MPRKRDDRPFPRPSLRHRGVVERRPGVWQATLSYGGRTNRREVARTFDREDAAGEWLEAQRVAVRAGTFLDPADTRQTFRTYVDQVWRPAQLHRPATQEATRVLDRHVFPRWEGREVGKLVRSDVQQLVNDLTVATSPATARTAYQWVTIVLRAAFDDGATPRNPCTRIRLPEAESAPVVIPTVDEVWRLAEVIRPDLRGYVLLLAGTGLRQAEAWGLTVDRLALLGRAPTLTVDRQLVTPTQGRPGFAPPKSRKARRTIPLAPVVVEALAAHLAAFPATPGELGGVAHAGLVFTTSTGGAWQRGGFAPSWRRAREAARLDPSTTSHTLRHYYASALIASNQSVKVVQERLGHATAQETLNRYAHLWPTDEDGTRDAVTAALARPIPTPLRAVSE